MRRLARGVAKRMKNKCKYLGQTRIPTDACAIWRTRKRRSGSDYSITQGRKIAAGEYVVRAGEEGGRMYFVRHKSVKVLKETDGSTGERRLAILRKGDTFGEMELIEVPNRSASVKARARYPNGRTLSPA